MCCVINTFSLFNCFLEEKKANIFVNLVKHLAIFFCVLTSEIFEASFLFVVKLLELL